MHLPMPMHLPMHLHLHLHLQLQLPQAQTVLDMMVGLWVDCLCCWRMWVQVQRPLGLLLN